MERTDAISADRLLVREGSSEYGQRRDLEDRTDPEKFGHCQLPLAPFDLVDRRVVQPKLGRELALREPGLLARTGKHREQLLGLLGSAVS